MSAQGLTDLHMPLTGTNMIHIVYILLALYKGFPILSCTILQEYCQVGLYKFHMADEVGGC